MSNGTTSGKLYLIGAGPGDPELLTLKAARILGECDVVLYDRLVSREVLSFARPDAELVYVGKHEGEQERTQGEIFELVRRSTRKGKTVARLKGGDPLVFGRGAEEWAVALESGIEVELIPGITSAVSVPGLAGIPLTFRGVAQSFAVVTGHCHDGLSAAWEKHAGVDTLVILMGVRNRAFIAQALIAAGRPVNEPVAFIESGSTPEERVVESTLGAVAAGDCEVTSPAVFVVGKVVALRARLTAGRESPAPPIPAAAV
ncbi:MAG: uroporphyrinogen-III C-methyltransferase [Acidobacteriaceae bacterium]|nr:uroporphyrinogen-III C-methyltransferase [Acidobacteriaceae bacterium]